MVLNTPLSSSICPWLVPHWLSCFKVLHYYHLFLCRANFAWDMQRRCRKKRNHHEHDEKANFFHVAKVVKFWMFFFCFVLFFIEKMPSSIIMFKSYVGKRSNSRSQMFIKTSALKNFAIFTGRNLVEASFDKVSGLQVCIFI